MHIRDAVPADVPEIQAIYAHHVLHGAGTFEEAPPSIEEMTARFEAIVERGWAFLVATDETGRLLEAAERFGFRQMFAVIGDSENIGSIGVHASLGFQRIGLLRASGLKFGRWIDTVYMQRALGRGDQDVPT